MALRRWEYGWRAEQRRRMCQHFYKVRYCNFYVRSSIHEAIIKQVAKKKQSVPDLDGERFADTFSS